MKNEEIEKLKKDYEDCIKDRARIYNRMVKSEIELSMAIEALEKFSNTEHRDFCAVAKEALKEIKDHENWWAVEGS